MDRITFRLHGADITIGLEHARELRDELVRACGDSTLVGSIKGDEIHTNGNTLPDGWRELWAGKPCLSPSVGIECAADYLVAEGLDEEAFAALLVARFDGIPRKDNSFGFEIPTRLDKCGAWTDFAKWPIVGRGWQPEERDTGTAAGWEEFEFSGAPEWAQRVLEEIPTGSRLAGAIFASLPERGE